MCLSALPIRSSALAALALLIAPAPLAARDVSRSELTARLSANPSPAEVRAEISDVTSVGGAPVDLAGLTADAEDAELVARVRALASLAPPDPATDAGAARGKAKAILSERTFRGRQDENLGDGVGSSWLFDTTLGWIVVILLTAVAAFVAFRIAKRRLARLSREPTHADTDPRHLDASALEAQAADAERRGDLSAAVRLLFQAGVRRLEERRVIAAGAPMTSGQLRRTLRSRTFDAIADRFDRIAYGGEAARAGDVTGARAGWDEITRTTATPS